VQSQDNDNTTDRPPRKPKRGPLPARLAGMRPDTSPRINIVELAKADEAPLARKGLRTTAGRIKAAEAARPPATKGVREHVWPGPRGPPPGPLGLFIQFSDLRSANLVVSYCGLTTLIKHHGFPPRALPRPLDEGVDRRGGAAVARRPTDHTPSAGACGGRR
jgi:hypothetical protein